MLKSIIFPQRYLQGAGALDQLPTILNSIRAQKVLAIVDPGVANFMEPKLKQVLKEGTSVEFIPFSGESTEDEMRKAAEAVKRSGCSVLLGVGGGKAIDTAKGALFFAETAKLVVIPTIVASDAPCSKNAVVYGNDHRVIKDIHGRANPEVVLIDSNIIAQAPTRFLSAGMGDAFATWFEAESHQKTMAPNFTGYSGTVTGYAIARLCYKTLLENGELAVQHCDQNIVTPQLEAVIEANALMSTIGFESGGLAAAHGFHQGIAEWREAHSALHGEKVAFGVAASLFLTHKPAKVIRKAYTFLSSVRLPITLEDLGVKEYSRDYLMVAVRRMVEPAECTHNEPVSYREEEYLNAMVAADLYGKKFKQEAFCCESVSDR